MTIIQRILNLYWQLIMFGINNLLNGLSGALAGRNAIEPIVKGAVALMIAFAIPGAILGVLAEALPVVLPIIVLCVIVGVALKLLSNQQKGLDFKSSILAFLQFNWLSSLFGSFSLPGGGGVSGRPITDMWKEKPFAYSSVDNIHAQLGWTSERRDIWFDLGDDPPHAILAGTAGSGKSNFLHVLIHSLLHRFSPDELNLYLFDYKDGVEFAVYANESVPHIKFVATVNDSEYGINALKWFQGEITRRNDEFKKNGVKDISGMRKNGKPMPRILIVIDEFQVLINDASVTEEAYRLFSDILRRGRSAGVHILLATQSLSGLRGSITGGFDTLKTQLGYRIALKCNQSDSRTILSDNNTEAATLVAKKEAICNKQNGVKEANVKFNVPYAEPVSCKKHLQDISTQLRHYGYTADTKVFDGANLPVIPSQQIFSKFRGKILLGEQLSFEAQPFAFQWERFQGNNLCVAGIEEKIRKGIIHSVLLSNQQGNLFDSVIYYNSDPNSPTTNFTGFSSVDVKNASWDCNIMALVGNISAKRSLLIIDSIDNARTFYPKKKEFVPVTTPTTPAEFLKVFLDKGPQHGSFVLAFVDNWGRWNNSSNNDYLENFEQYIGFCLSGDDAGSLITGSMGRPLMGLDRPTKAVFVNRQRNTQTLFRPFVPTK